MAEQSAEARIVNMEPILKRSAEEVRISQTRGARLHPGATEALVADT
jgi:hypothetical protein